MYEILFEQDTRILTIRYEGFWSIDVASRFIEEFSLTIAGLRRHFGQIAVMSDIRDFPVQSMPVLDMLNRFAHDELKRYPMRWALLSKPGLATLQAKRETLMEGALALFNDAGQARAWLYSALD